MRSVSRISVSHEALGKTGIVVRKNVSAKLPRRMNKNVKPAPSPLVGSVDLRRGLVRELTDGHNLAGPRKSPTVET